MAKKTRIWLIAAAVFVVAGLFLFAAAMTGNHWNFGMLSTQNYETNTYVIDNAFHSISINTDTADIRFVLSDDGSCKVVCYEPEKAKHAAFVRDGFLCIGKADEQNWYEYINLFPEKVLLTIYLPRSEYSVLHIQESTGDINIADDFRFESMAISVSTGDVENYASVTGELKIEASTGDIRLAKLSAESIDLKVSTGKIFAEDIACTEDFRFTVSTGDVQIAGARCGTLLTAGRTGCLYMKDVIAKEVFKIERTTGDISFKNCDAAEIYIETDTGYVAGSLLSDKIFSADANTGSVDIPQSAAGGKCEITTNTGDITIIIADITG